VRHFVEVCVGVIAAKLALVVLALSVNEVEGPPTHGITRQIVCARACVTPVVPRRVGQLRSFE